MPYSIPTVLTNLNNDSTDTSVSIYAVFTNITVNVNDPMGLIRCYPQAVSACNTLP